jgi:eukaryotic-like serine/threonine-protein kinase
MSSGREFSPCRRPRNRRYANRVPISSAVSTVLLRRMRRLDIAERLILMHASVIGRRFRLAVVAATTALGEDRSLRVLDKACMLQFVIRENSHGDWFAFRHALIRDVAYEEFIATRIRAVHRRIAQALEHCAETDELPLDNLAYHSWAARDATRSIRYNERAGDRAVAAFANKEARTFYERACEFADPDSKPYHRLTAKLLTLQGDE